MAKNRSKENGSTNDDWETPDYLLDQIKKEFGDFFDPCPLRSKFNGLDIDWQPVNYINPPYNIRDKPKFIRKAFRNGKKVKQLFFLFLLVLIH